MWANFTVTQSGPSAKPVVLTCREGGGWVATHSFALSLRQDERWLGTKAMFPEKRTLELKAVGYTGSILQIWNPWNWSRLRKVGYFLGILKKDLQNNSDMLPSR